MFVTHCLKTSQYRRGISLDGQNIHNVQEIEGLCYFNGGPLYSYGGQCYSYGGPYLNIIYIICIIYIYYIIELKKIQKKPSGSDGNRSRHLNCFLSLFQQFTGRVPWAIEPHH